MIHFFYENIEENIDENLKNWIENIIISEGKKTGEINYIFCDDEYLPVSLYTSDAADE